MTNPPVTLLIPCYNAAPFLPALMASVRAMSTPFSAVIAYDDGSRDDTVAVARALGMEILTPNPNRGVAHARNRLAAAARTEWFHFQDADDPIHPDFLTRLGPLATADRDVVSCDSDWVAADDGRLVIAWRYDPAELAGGAYRHLLGHALGLNASLIRKTAWDAVGGCDESLSIWEDADAHIRMARAGARWAHVPEVLSRSLRRPESFSHDYLRGWRCRLHALEGYAIAPGAVSVADVLAGEAETAATQLAACGDSAAAQRALALCRQLGGHPPTTRSPWLRALKPFFPTLTLLRLQHRLRQRG